MAVVRVDVNPEVLKWAREKSGYTIDTLSKSIKENVEKWESGEIKPTWNQLIELGSVYKRPASFFLMSKPPIESDEDITDYRTFNEITAFKSPKLLYEIRRAKERRQIALNIVEGYGIVINNFQWQIKEKDPTKFVKFIREKLGITIDEQVSWRSNRYDAFNKWKNAIENLDILIFETEDVDPLEMRGFCISKKKFPIIVLNGSDEVNPRIFTLIHELVHIILNNSALCDLKWKDETEIFCNKVAGEVLVPKKDLLEDNIVVSHEGVEWDDEELKRISNKFKVSKEVILRRLLIFKRTSNNFYNNKKKEWDEKFRMEKERKKRELKESKKEIRRAQPPLIIKYNGHSFTNLVLSAYENGNLTSIEFSNYLGGIKLKHIIGISEKIHGAG